jgi:hypothetical protein
MVRFVLALPLLALLAACPTPGPVVPPNPDASDASALGDSPPPPPPAIVDGGFAFTGPCAAACTAMALDGCVVRSDCEAVLENATGVAIGSKPLVRNAATGQWLTCADLAATKTAASVKALGQSCGP